MAESIYDEITDFANYAFNKAHAVCYAIVAYQTAWFKCHYPREYMAALLTSVLDSQGKIAEYIAECRSLGIRLLPPDINQSGPDFTVAGRGHPLRPGRPERGGPGLYQRGAGPAPGGGALHAPSPTSASACRGRT